MAKEKVIRCTSCGEEIPVGQGMTEGFCLHCGEPFKLVDENAAGDLLPQHALGLFDKEDWVALAGYAERANAPAMALLHETAAIHTLYETYAREADELARDSAPKGVLRFITGRNTYGESPIHVAFYEEIEARMAIVLSLLENDAVDPALRERAVLVLTDRLLSVNKETGTPTYWSLVAVEQHAQPLIPYLPLQALVERYTAYRAANPDNQSLPNQLKIKKTMEQVIADKGGQIPKKKWFGKK